MDVTRVYEWNNRRRRNTAYKCTFRRYTLSGFKNSKASNIEHHQCPPYDVPVHSVKLKKDMPLYLLIKKEIISVNSYHHQAIKNIAPKLSAMAYSEDGLIEAICAPEKKFVWATQWHPEFLFKKDNDNLKILKEFVKSCT